MAAPDETLFSEVGNYVLENEAVHDCFFILGAEKKRIGAVKLFLINQSRAWWSMLSTESNIAEQGDIQLPDIEPEVFILLLKHCYGGLNDCSHLSDDMMLKLCYCGDKYLMTSLNKKIAHRLQPSSVDSVFAALHALVYFNLKAVEKATEEIIQTKTDEIFRHAQFLECDIESVAYIAKQDRLNCEEINLFDALVVWAQHKVAAGSELREILLRPLRHVRLLTLSSEDLCDRVFSLKILTSDEISQICTKKFFQNFCSTLEKRRERTAVSLKGKKAVLYETKPNHRSCDSSYDVAKISSSSIVMGNHCIKMQSVSCKGEFIEGSFSFGQKYTRHGTIKIYRMSIAEHTYDYHVTIPFTVETKSYESFDIPTLVNGQGITLKAGREYHIRIEFLYTGIPSWYNSTCVDGHNFEHGVFYCSSSYNRHGEGKTSCHIVKFKYIYE